MNDISHNFAFCISEYLQNRYNFILDERICYLLGCSWGLQKLSRKDSFFISDQTHLNDLSTSYIEAFNPQALEYFVTNLRTIYHIDHNNDVSDARWIASDYQTLGKIKTFVSMSNSLFADKIVIDNQPIYGVAYMDECYGSTFDIDQIRKGYLLVDILKNYTIKLSVNEFIKHWQVKDCEMFNANRYLIISPQFKFLQKTLPSLIKNALQLNYLRITNETILCGSRLMSGLTENLKKNRSEECIKKYIEFLLYSLRKNSLLGMGDMDRGYFSSCFQHLYDLHYIKDSLIIDNIEICKVYWADLYQKIQGTKEISFVELYEMLREITEVESKFEKTLKAIVQI